MKSNQEYQTLSWKLNCLSDLQPSEQKLMMLRMLSLPNSVASFLVPDAQALVDGATYTDVRNQVAKARIDLEMLQDLEQNLDEEVDKEYVEIERDLNYDAVTKKTTEKFYLYISSQAPEDVSRIQLNPEQMKITELQNLTLKTLPRARESVKYHTYDQNMKNATEQLLDQALTSFTALQQQEATRDAGRTM